MSSPNASSRWPKCASARASRAGAEGARRDTMPGGGGALATVHSGQSQAATGQHDGSALLQPGLTCTGRTEAVLSSGARRRIWANFDRRHSSPRARSDKMLTVRKLRLVERKRLPCEPAAGWLVADFRWRILWASLFIVPNTVLWFMGENGVLWVSSAVNFPVVCSPSLPYPVHDLLAGPEYCIKIL